MRYICSYKAFTAILIGTMVNVSAMLYNALICTFIGFIEDNNMLWYYHIYIAEKKMKKSSKMFGSLK